MGLDSSITLDLGEQKTVCALEILWHRGNERINSFEVSTSNDGSVFEDIIAGQSSGNTISPEKYEISDVAKHDMLADSNRQYSE